MASPTQIQGLQVEEEACQYYLESGATLLVRNYRKKWGEIDLVFEESKPDGKSELVFVEVKARQNIGSIEAVTWQKRQRLRRVIDTYLGEYQGNATSIRFDVFGKEGKNVLIIKDARLTDPD